MDKKTAIVDMLFKLLKLRRAIDSRIEPPPFRKRDFTSNDPFVHEIMETGIEIFNNT